MHHAVADKLRVFQGGDHGEHTLLLRPFQMGLEAYDVINAALGVVLAQLHHSKGLLARFGVPESHRLEGTIAQGIPATAGHYLHRHTALKHARVLKAVDLRLLGGGELLPESVVLLLGHGTVDIVRGTPVISGGKPGAFHVYALKGDQGGGSVKEVEVAVLGVAAANGLGQRLSRQGAGGHDDMPLLGDVQYFPLHHGDVGVGLDLLGNGGGEGVTVYRQGASRLHPVLIGAGHDEGVAAAQLLLQQSHRVLQLIGAQGVGAHQLSKIGAVVGRSHFVGFHLMQAHRDAPVGQLPGRLASCEASSNDNNRFHSTS